MLGVMLGLVLWAQTPSSDGPARTPSEQFQSLLRDRQAFVEELKTAAAKLETDEARNRFHDENAKRDHAFFARALELANNHPDDPAAVDALVWVVYQGQPPERGTALRRITRDHIKGPRLKPALSYISMRRYHMQEDSGLYEALLREVMAKGPERESRGLAGLRLGQLLRLRADSLRRLEQFPDDHGRMNERHGLGPEAMKPLRERTPEDLAAEADELFERTIKEYADIQDYFYPGRDDVSLGALGDGAKRELFELHHLSIGKTAPEIDGEDIDGKPLKLSDYRGKVVVLVFWGTWCGPCMAMVPHERTLATRMQGKPFALLGVNSDEDRERVKQAIGRERITWRSWWDGGSQEGPIATRWNVDGWPATYVIDSKGVIRYKDLRDEPLDKAVDTLLKELKVKP